MQHNKGFTLIEVMVVIAILGILAAVIMPRIVGMETETGHQNEIVYKGEG